MKLSATRLYLGLTFSLVICACAEGQALNMQALPKADAYLTDLTEKGAFRGSVLIGIDGKIAFEKGYGYADEEWSAFNTPRTKFRIASLTKQFTGACILLLQERRLINVGEPISKYIPDLPPSWQPITIHQLLTHTSGLPNFPGMPRVEQVLNRTGASPRDLLAVAASKPLEFAPGSQLRYTNTGYILLGMLIEKVSGTTYAEFLQRNIFTPLGMADSGYDDAAKVLKERASGYEVTNGQIRNSDFIDISVAFSAGGIYSTVEDMYRWSEALTVPGKLLQAQSLEQMFAIYPETLFQGAHYGYGVVLSERFGRLLYNHGGGIKGFETVIQLYPKEHLCIIILENLDPTQPWSVGDHIAAELFGTAPR